MREKAHPGLFEGPVDGYISSGGDLLRGKMTIADAKRRCLELEGCKGFCHRGAPTEEDVVEIVFKGKWNNAIGKNKWASYRCRAATLAPATLIDALQRTFQAPCNTCRNVKVSQVLVVVNAMDGAELRRFEVPSTTTVAAIKALLDAPFAARLLLGHELLADEDTLESKAQDDTITLTRIIEDVHPLCGVWVNKGSECGWVCTHYESADWRPTFKSWRETYTLKPDGSAKYDCLNEDKSESCSRQFIEATGLCASLVMKSSEMGVKRQEITFMWQANSSSRQTSQEAMKCSKCSVEDVDLMSHR